MNAYGTVARRLEPATSDGGQVRHLLYADLSAYTFTQFTNTI